MINICNCYVKSSLWWNFFLKQWHYRITVLYIVLTTDRIKGHVQRHISGRIAVDDLPMSQALISKIWLKSWWYGSFRSWSVMFINFSVFIRNVFFFLNHGKKRAQNKFTWSRLTKCEVSATLCVITKFTHFSWFHTMQFLRKSLAIDTALHSLV